MLPFAPRAHVACHSCPWTPPLASLIGPAWCLSWLASLRVGPWCFLPPPAFTWLSSRLGLLRLCFHRPACSVGCHRGGACPSWVGAPVACGSCIVLDNLVPLWCVHSWLSLLLFGRVLPVSSQARCLSACGPVRLLALTVARSCARFVSTHSIFAPWQCFWASSRGFRGIHLNFSCLWFLGVLRCPGQDQITGRVFASFCAMVAVVSWTCFCSRVMGRKRNSLPLSNSCRFASRCSRSFSLGCFPHCCFQLGSVAKIEVPKTVICGHIFCYDQTELRGKTYTILKI